jgi:hypothetical protein
MIIEIPFTHLGVAWITIAMLGLFLYDSILHRKEEYRRGHENGFNKGHKEGLRQAYRNR